MICSKICEKYICHAKLVPLLYKISQAIVEDKSLSEIVSVLFEVMKQELGIIRGTINLFNRHSGKIFIHQSFGLTQEEEARGIYSEGEGITGKVMQSKKTIIVPRISGNPDFLNRTKSRTRREELESSFFCVPIVKGKKILGSISAERFYENPDLLKQDVTIVTIFASIIAQAIELYLMESEEKAMLKKENKRLLLALKEKFSPSNMIGTSEAMLEVYAFIQKIAKAKTTVLILGESGVGKELVAEAIHYQSDAGENPFIKFNCAALPENMVESELFGHEKGSFTGALNQRLGRFEEARGGTIFLDEVGELSLQVQAKLLRVLQEKTFERVGSNKSISVDLRILAATNKDLKKMVEQGTFREDLFYRLNVFPILVPPLRERGNDLIALTSHFIEKYSKLHNRPCKSLSVEALDRLLLYSWPGNVRELENTIERAVILSNENILEPYHFPASISGTVSSETRTQEKTRNKIDLLEQDAIINALKENRGNITGAASMLGLTRRMLGIRMEKYNLNYKDFRTGSRV